MARERCNELCTKASTGMCAHCDKLDEQDRFERPFWMAVASFNKGLHWFCSHRPLVGLIIVSLLFLVPVFYAWWLQLNQLNQSRVCQIGSLQERIEYLEIQLTEYHPSDPIFSGQLFFVSADPSNAGVSTVAVTSTGLPKRRYGSTRHSIKTGWDPSWNALKPQAPENFSLVSETGSHQTFPLDSALFDFELDIDPPINFRAIRITNRVPGFVMYCSTMQVNRPQARTVHIRFGLDRSPIIQLFAVMLVVAPIGFLVLILRTAQLQNLATSMAAFFFSLWSLRGILAPMMKTFPTLFDYGILTLCLLAVLCVSWRLYLLKRPESGV